MAVKTSQTKWLPWIAIVVLVISGASVSVGAFLYRRLTTTPLPFEDGFEEGLRPEWQVDAGVWRMVDGKIRSDNAGRLFVGSKEWTDYSMSVEVHDWSSGQKVQLILRATEGQYMALEIESQSASDFSRLLFVSNGNTKKLIEKASHAYGVMYTRFEAKGDIYKAYIGDIKVFEVQDATLKKGRAGLAVDASQVLFDNFKVTALR